MKSVLAQSHSTGRVRTEALCWVRAGFGDFKVSCRSRWLRSGCRSLSQRVSNLRLGSICLNVNTVRTTPHIMSSPGGRGGNRRDHDPGQESSAQARFHTLAVKWAMRGVVDQSLASEASRESCVQDLTRSQASCERVTKCCSRPSCGFVRRLVGHRTMTTAPPTTITGSRRNRAGNYQESMCQFQQHRNQAQQPISIFSPLSEHSRHRHDHNGGNNDGHHHHHHHSC